MKWLWLILLFCISNHLFSQNPFNHDPSLTLGGETEESFLRIEDFTVDHHGNIYVLDKDEKKIFKYDSNGARITGVSGKGQGPGELIMPGGMVWAKDSLWVADVMNNSVSLFKNDEFSKKINLEQTPYSLSVLDDKVCVAPTSIYGEFNLFDTVGNHLSGFTVDASIVNRKIVNESMSRLWGMIKTSPLANDKILIGFLYLDLLAVIDLNGRIVSIGNMKDFYHTHPIKSRRGVIPGFFSALAFSEGPQGSIWVAACHETDKLCGTLYRFDPDTMLPLDRMDTGRTVRTIRYFPGRGDFGVINDDYTLSLYRTDATRRKSNSESDFATKPNR